MSGRRQALAYAVAAAAIVFIWFGLEAVPVAILFIVFAIGFVAALLIVVDAWRKVFGFGTRGANDVDP